MVTIPVVLSCFVIGGWVYLAFFHDGFWQLIIDNGSPEPTQWPSVDIIVPARNEAELLPQSLPALLAQNYLGPWRIFWWTITAVTAPPPSRKKSPTILARPIT